MWPVSTRHFPNQPRTFQEDNLPCHVSRQANQWKTKNGINTLQWPSKSPDINNIDNLWNMMKLKLKRHLGEIKNGQDFEHVIHDI